MYSNSGVPPRHSHTLQGTCRLRKLPGPFNVAQGLGVSLDPHTLAVVPAPLRLTLYELEERLTALADSTELVALEQEQEFLADFQAALLAAKDKRDPVAQFLAYCESQSALAPSAERVFQVGEARRAIARARRKTAGSRPADSCGFGSSRPEPRSLASAAGALDGGRRGGPSRDRAWGRTTESRFRARAGSSGRFVSTAEPAVAAMVSSWARDRAEEGARQGVCVSGLARAFATSSRRDVPIARAREGCHRRQDSAPADSYAKPGRVARCCGGGDRRSRVPY